MTTISELKNNLKEICDEIQGIIGIENVILVEKNGYPLVSAGVWLSRDEIFEVSAISSAINASIRKISEDTIYSLVEGENYKLALFRIPIVDNFFLVTTMSNRVNLGALILKTNQVLQNVGYELERLSAIVTTPLLSYDDSEIKAIERNFQIKAHEKNENVRISRTDLFLDKSNMDALNEIILNFKASLEGVLKTFSLTTIGGLPILVSEMSSNESIILSTVFDSSRKLLYTLRNTNIEQFTNVSASDYYIIQAIDNLIIYLRLDREKVKLGLLRFLLSALKKAIKKSISFATKDSTAKPLPINIDSIIGVM